VEQDGPEIAATTVGADLNTWVSYETTVRLMQTAFPESPPWDGVGTRSGFPADHIFFRTSRAPQIQVEQYVRVENRYYSDHHPRRLTMKISPAP